MTDLLNEFFQETDRNLSEARTELDNWERNLTDPQALNGVFRIVHNVKATCHVLGFGRVESLAHAAEDVLYAIREGQAPIVPEVAAAIRETIGRIEEILEEIRIERSEPLGNDQALIDLVRGFLGDLDNADIAPAGAGGYDLDALMPTRDRTITLDDPAETGAPTGAADAAGRALLGGGEPLLAETRAEVGAEMEAESLPQRGGGTGASGEGRQIADSAADFGSDDFFLEDGDVAPVDGPEIVPEPKLDADGAGLLSGTEPLFDFSDEPPPTAAEDGAAPADAWESGASSPQSDTVTGIDLIHPNPEQPRKRIDDEGLAALALSISTHGLLQPILVRRHPTLPGQYEIVAGERRWRAAHMAGLTRIRIALLETNTRDSLQISLVENLQREDLAPMEEAEGYHRLIETFGHTQDAVADIVGRSRSHVANTLRLRGLPPAVKEMLQQGAITPGHARALLTFAEPEELARKVVDKGLSVRETEMLAKRTGAAPVEAVQEVVPRADLRVLERELSSLLGTKVRIAMRGERGRVMLHFTSVEKLEEILGQLRHLARSSAA